MPSWAAACLLLNSSVLSCRVDAGKVELDGAQYLGFRIPLTISQLVWIEAILVGGAEVYRNRERDPETRLYPGKPAALAHPCPG
jgi:light-harvesting complex II chlorophyll a/b binding protein 4